jgi:hypothetical protein
MQEVTHGEVVKAMRRMLTAGLSVRAVAQRLGRSPQWVQDNRTGSMTAKHIRGVKSYALDPTGRSGPYDSRWWVRWNAVCGTELTRKDAEAMRPCD